MKYSQGFKLAFLCGIINLKYLDMRDSTDGSHEVPWTLKAGRVFMCFAWEMERGHRFHPALGSVH